MSVLSIFSFRGRMRRLPYGLFTLAAIPLGVAATVILVISLLVILLGRLPHELTAELRADPNINAILKTPLGVVLPFLIVSVTGLGVLYVAWLACAVRRLHDMNVTGWAVLALALVAGLPWTVLNAGEWYAYAGAVLVGLVLSFWPTSSGAERFGPDPRTL